MTYRVVIEQEAQQEFVEAVDFYDKRQPGLGQRFARDLQAFFRIVSQNPERFRPVSRLIRKARLPKPWP
jgi:plasmid stabilization system protein ParE